MWMCEYIYELFNANEGIWKRKSFRDLFPCDRTFLQLQKFSIALKIYLGYIVAPPGVHFTLIFFNIENQLKVFCHFYLIIK